MVHDCDAVGRALVQEVSETVVLVELTQETVRDCVALTQVPQPPVCHAYVAAGVGFVVVIVGGTYGVAGVVDTDGVIVGGVLGCEICTATAPHLLVIATRVLGPTAPYPVVAAVPDDAIPFFDCHCLTAFSVIAPKKPVAESDAKRFWEIRNCWSCVTSVPREPRERLRARFGQDAAPATLAFCADIFVFFCTCNVLSCARRT